MLRILSDLHFHDATSRLNRLEELEPLLEGVDELWLNGDTCDSQSGMTVEEVDALKSFFRQRVTKVVFITGNHDPDISAQHDVSACEGKLWAFHGDAIFPDIVPWSRVREQIVNRVRQIRVQHPERDFDSFAGRMATIREACTGFRRECDPARREASYRLKRIWTEFFPPQQLWAMVHAWATFASQVDRAADRWHPSARIIATGHVHLPRVWQSGERTIINTGAFSSPLGTATVELSGGIVRVRRVVHRAGAWRAGRVWREIPLAEPGSGPDAPSP